MQELLWECWELVLSLKQQSAETKSDGGIKVLDWAQFILEVGHKISLHILIELRHRDFRRKLKLKKQVKRSPAAFFISQPTGSTV